MHLNNLLVGSEGLHHLRLQFRTAVLACSHGIDANGHDDAVTLVHLRRDAARQSVNVVGRHCIIHVDMQRTNLHVRTVVVQYQVEDTMHALEVGYLLLDLLGVLGRDTRTQQFVDRRGQHLETGLDNHNRYQGAKDTVERHPPQQHDSRRYERGQRDDGIKQRVRARGYQRVALQLFALLLHILAQDKLHHNSHHDNHQCRRGVFRFRGVEDFLHRLDERGDTGRQHDDGDDDGTEILDATETEGMLPVGRTLGEFGTHDGDDARQRITQVVDGIHHDGHTAGQDTYCGLEACQQHVGYNAYPTGTDYLRTSVHNHKTY